MLPGFLQGSRVLNLLLSCVFSIPFTTGLSAANIDATDLFDASILTLPTSPVEFETVQLNIAQLTQKLTTTNYCALKRERAQACLALVETILKTKGEKLVLDPSAAIQPAVAIAQNNDQRPSFSFSTMASRTFLRAGFTGAQVLDRIPFRDFGVHLENNYAYQLGALEAKTAAAAQEIFLSLASEQPIRLLPSASVERYQGQNSSLKINTQMSDANSKAINFEIIFGSYMGADFCSKLEKALKEITSDERFDQDAVLTLNVTQLRGASFKAAVCAAKLFADSGAVIAKVVPLLEKSKETYFESSEAGPFRDVHPIVMTSADTKGAGLVFINHLLRSGKARLRGQAPKTSNRLYMLQEVVVPNAEDPSNLWQVGLASFFSGPEDLPFESY